MPLIKAKNNELIDLKIKMEKSVYDEMAKYCQHFGIDKHEEFLSQAASIILNKDKEWKKLKGTRDNQN